MFGVIATRIAARRAMGHSIRYLSTPSSGTQDPHPPPPPPTAPLAPPSRPGPSSLSLDFSAAENAEADTQRTGAKSSKGSLSSSERRRRVLGRVALGVFVMALGAQSMWMGREWDEHELKEKKLVSSISISENPKLPGELTLKNNTHSELKMHPQRGGDGQNLDSLTSST
jgi:mitochondrial import inner membrane translocase subunit TIM50